MRPIHPGEVLREEFGVTRATGNAGDNVEWVNDLLAERVSVTPERARLLEFCTGASAEFWLRLQAQFDLRSEGWDANGGPVP
jgi:addiction module HigA family antidote